MIAKSKDKYARHKLASIPILLCILAYVLFGQSPESEVALEVPLNLAPQSNRVTSIATSPAQTEPILPWPEVMLEFLAQPNPLANYLHTPSSGELRNAITTAVNVDPSITNIDPALNLARDLSENQVKYVFRSDRRQLVMLGQQILEKGQELANGVQLTDIQDHALILSNRQPMNSPTPPNNLID